MDMEIKDTIINLMEENRYGLARKEMLELNVVDISALIEDILDEGEEENKVMALRLFRMLPKDTASDVFAYFSSETQLDFVKSISDKEIGEIVNDLFIDDAVDFLEELPASVVKRVLAVTDENTRKVINRFLNYPEDSAGSIMTIEYVDLKKQLTVAQALVHIRKTGVDKETINTCYVTDRNRILEGAVSIRKILLSDDDTVIDEIMDTNVVSINAHDDQEQASMLFRKYDLLSMPVVDNEGRLVGIITVDDIVDVISEEATEDFEIMGAMHPSDSEYLKTPVFTLAKNRIIWLLVLMISATFTGRIISSFESMLQNMVILTAFIPMLMDTGGNAGAQTSTMIIRGLALDEIHTYDIFRVIWKEFRVSLIASTILAVVNFARMLLIEQTTPMVSLVVSLTVMCAVIVAKFVGSVLPLAAKKIGLDPALMASPLITTIVDAVTLVMYFGIASALLPL